MGFTEQQANFTAKIQYGKHLLKDCDLWKAATDASGYGKFWISDRKGPIRTHRVMFELYHLGKQL